MLCSFMMKGCPDTFRELLQYHGYRLVEIRKQKGAIVRIKKANPILKRPVNKLFPTEYTYHNTNQTENTREQKLRREAAVIDQLKKKYDC